VLPLRGCMQVLGCRAYPSCGKRGGEFRHSPFKELEEPLACLLFVLCGLEKYAAICSNPSFFAALANRCTGPRLGFPGKSSEQVLFGLRSLYLHKLLRYRRDDVPASCTLISSPTAFSCSSPPGKEDIQPRKKAIADPLLDLLEDRPFTPCIRKDPVRMQQVILEVSPRFP